MECLRFQTLHQVLLSVDMARLQSERTRVIHFQRIDAPLAEVSPYRTVANGSFGVICLPMTWRVMPREWLPGLMRLYGAFVLGAIILAVFAALRASRPERVAMAAIAFTVCVSVGALWISGIFAAQLRASGAGRVPAVAFVSAVALTPGLLLYFSQVWGPIIYAAAVPAGLLIFAVRR
jgi:hypothetical protein